MALKLISINVERSKHLDRVLPFIEREQPDVLCVQELMEYDLPEFERRVGAGGFATMTVHPGEGTPGVVGVGLFSRYPALIETNYYWGDGAKLAFDFSSAETKHATESHALLIGTVAAPDASYTIATTHFTWTPDGSPDDFQRADLAAMLAILEGRELILCGDFNAPRIHQGAPGEIFSALASRYTDAIPPIYETSVDISLHRAGKDRPHELADKMVDGLFTTPAYRAKDVHLVKGLSDHMAIVASIEKGTAVH